MNLVSLFYAYLAVKYLAAPFDKLALFRNGTIDKDGNVLPGKSLDAFARLMFGVRNILSKVPGARLIVTTYALTRLFKECYSGTELAMLIESTDNNPVRHHPEYELFLEDMTAGGEGIAGLGTDSPGIVAPKQPLDKKKKRKLLGLTLTRKSTIM